MKHYMLYINHIPKLFGIKNSDISNGTLVYNVA